MLSGLKVKCTSARTEMLEITRHGKHVGVLSGQCC